MLRVMWQFTEEQKARAIADLKAYVSPIPKVMTVADWKPTTPQPYDKQETL